MEESKSATVVAVLEALRFAALKHRNQRRKDAEASPYINHPIEVARLLGVEAGIDDAIVLQAAVLHDTIEDTETSYDEVRSAFGKDVADVVLEVTDDKTIRDRGERKRLQLENAPKKSWRATLIKVADKTCNLRDIAGSPPATWSRERKLEYFDWAKAVVDRLPPSNKRVRELFDMAYAARASA